MTFNQYLDEVGLNLQACFSIDDLPVKVATALSTELKKGQSFSHLLLIGHLGSSLWKQIPKRLFSHEDPIDSFTISQLKDAFRLYKSNTEYRILYPGPSIIDLQALGESAGWHYQSPFLVGINQQWGSWFAYRAVALVSEPIECGAAAKVLKSSCEACVKRPCYSACPANAITSEGFDLDACVNYRKSSNSKCQSTCLSRIACPEGAEHRYSQEQIAYHYDSSLKTIHTHY